MKNYQKLSNMSFSNLLNDNTVYDTSGRPNKNKFSNKEIFEDIIKKLDIKKNSTFLDIGCGCGEITEKIINFSLNNNIKLSLNDIDPVIKTLKNKNLKNSNIDFYSGVFQKLKIKKKFDYILVYSVIHYINDPILFIDKIFKLLNTNGKILIGDIPNIDKKARFSISTKGRIFNGKYFKLPLRKIPKYRSYEDFIKNNKNLRKDIDDKFINKIFKIYRAKYCNVYLLEQKKTLPSCYTREDILIEKLK